MNVDAAHALDRAIRRMLVSGPTTGELAQDLAGPIVEVAVEFAGDEDECSVADLNELFGLDLDDPDSTVRLADRAAAVGAIARLLHGEEAIIAVLASVTLDWSVVASSPGGTATMMHDDGIGLYQFTVDDRVYFFMLGEPDVCDTQWWFAHRIGDATARASAVQAGRAAIGLTHRPGES